MTKCPTCHGSTFHPDDEDVDAEFKRECPKCDGWGVIPDEEDIKVQMEERENDWKNGWK